MVQKKITLETIGWLGHGAEGKTEADKGTVGRLVLAQRPITLVLMMINSCKYSTNGLVFN